nr:immunoglobulin light chain junction region [Macaca mulatta]
SMQSLEFPLTF